MRSGAPYTGELGPFILHAHLPTWALQQSCQTGKRYIPWRDEEVEKKKNSRKGILAQGTTAPKRHHWNPNFSDSSSLHKDSTTRGWLSPRTSSSCLGVTITLTSPVLAEAVWIRGFSLAGPHWKRAYLCSRQCCVCVCMCRFYECMCMHTSVPTNPHSNTMKDILSLRCFTGEKMRLKLEKNGPCICCPCEPIAKLLKLPNI